MTSNATITPSAIVLVGALFFSSPLAAQQTLPDTIPEPTAQNIDEARVAPLRGDIPIIAGETRLPPPNRYPAVYIVVPEDARISSAQSRPPRVYFRPIQGSEPQVSPLYEAARASEARERVARTSQDLAIEVSRERKKLQSMTKSAGGETRRKIYRAIDALREAEIALEQADQREKQATNEAREALERARNVLISER